MKAEIRPKIEQYGWNVEAFQEFVQDVDKHIDHLQSQLKEKEKEIDEAVEKCDNSHGMALEYKSQLKEITTKYNTIKLAHKHANIACDKAESQLEKERAQKEITHSLWQEGVCPKCGVSMFDKFNAEIHNVKRCGNKKAVADNNECA